MRKSRLEALREQKAKKREPKTIGSYYELLETMLGGPLLPTQRKIIDSTKPINLYLGQAGSGKTAIGVAAVLGRALTEPGSRWFIARKDYNDLKATTYTEATKQLSNLPPGTLLDRTKDPPEQWVIQSIGTPDDPYPEPSTITFLGVDSADLGSTEFNGGFFDEADELDDERKTDVLTGSRIRRVTGGPKYVIMSFNGPPKTHFLYKWATGRNEKEVKVQEPKAALFIPAFGENKANVRKGYYEDMQKQYANDPVLLTRLVNGGWVTVFEGTPVYSSFKRHIHVRKNLRERWDPFSTLFRFWDFGYNHPRCCWAQVDDRGRLLIFAEEVGEREEIGPFSRRVKARTRMLFGAQEAPIVDYGDPAARQKKDTGSTLVELSKENIQLLYLLANIEPGVRTVRAVLSTLIDGEPQLMFDESCTVLIDALSGGYALDPRSAKLMPKKDGFYDNSADMLRYGVTNIYGVTNQRDPGEARGYDDDWPTNLAQEGG